MSRAWQGPLIRPLPVDPKKVGSSQPSWASSLCPLQHTHVPIVGCICLLLEVLLLHSIMKEFFIHILTCHAYMHNTCPPHSTHITHTHHTCLL